jgi:predicted nucleotidyltransferase
MVASGSADVLTGQTEVNTVPFPEGLVLGGPGSYDRSMNPALQDRSTELSTLCRRHHVRRLSVFGSASRDEMRTDSDVDLLIEFEAGHSPSLAGFARLKQELEATLGVASIDLATPAILRNPYRRQAIVGDLQQLYAA